MDFLDENIPLSTLLTELSQKSEEEISFFVENVFKKKVIELKNLKSCNDYCNDHRTSVMNIFKENGVELLSHAYSFYNIYIPTLCKTVVIFGEEHSHQGSCEEFGFNKDSSNVVTISDAIEMILLNFTSNCTTDPPILCLSETSDWFQGRSALLDDMSLITYEEYDRMESANMEDTFKRAYLHNPKCSISIDIRDYIDLYMDQRSNSILTKTIEGLTQTSLTFNKNEYDKEFLEIKKKMKNKSNLNNIRRFCRNIERIVDIVPHFRNLKHLVDPSLLQELMDRLKEIADETGSLHDSELIDFYFYVQIVLMDFYTSFVISTSPQNLILIHVGGGHADNLHNLLFKIFPGTIKTFSTSFESLHNLQDTYFFKNYPEEMSELKKNNFEIPDNHRTDFEKLFVNQHEHINKNYKTAFTCLPLFDGSPFWYKIEDKILFENKTVLEALKELRTEDGKLQRNLKLF